MIKRMPVSSCNSNDIRCKHSVHKSLTMSWSLEKPMPTQPVVVACNVKVMVSPFTVYVILYTPFDEDLSPEHESVAVDVRAVINRGYVTLREVNTCVLYKTHQCTPQQHPCCVSSSHQQRH